MSNQDVVIKVDQVHKNFRLPHQKFSSLKQNAVHLLTKKTYSNFVALDDVSFEIKRGEFFGIVGRNGCGKSTLLKILAGIYVPSSGHVKISGTLSPFIELGVGFNPELTARDNVFLNGAILGLSRKQIEEKFDEIIGFAELEDFVDQKLKNFSSGMQVRLAFSISIQAQSDILLIDEVLAVGDANFQAKCYDVFRKMKRQNKTVVFVSHDMSALRDFCDRVVLLDKGSVLLSGSPDQAINAYNRLNLAAAEVQMDKIEEKSQRWGGGQVSITDTWTESKGHKKSVFEGDDAIDVTIQAKVNKDITNPIVGMVVKNTEGLRLLVTNSLGQDIMLGSLKKGQGLSAKISIQNVFANGKYTVSPAVANARGEIIYEWVEDAHSFEVKGRPVSDGLMHPETQIKIMAEKA